MNLRRIFREFDAKYFDGGLVGWRVDIPQIYVETERRAKRSGIPLSAHIVAHKDELSDEATKSKFSRTSPSLTWRVDATLCQLGS